jgi:hypothetical protein
MTRIDTTWTHRPIDTVQREDRRDRAAEVILLTVGIVFGSLLVGAEDAYGAGQAGRNSLRRPPRACRRRRQRAPATRT